MRVRKLMACLVVLGVCLIPGSATTTPPPCTLICCPPDDWDAECNIGHPYIMSTCAWWWAEGGNCP